MSSNTQYMREYRARNREKCREYNRFYNRVWRLRNGYDTEQRSQEKYPEKIRARNILNYAVRKGIIKRGACEVCSKPNAQAHHESYEVGKELEVRWFCPVHHREYEHKVSPVYQQNSIDNK